MLDGRRFRAVADVVGGDVSPETVFTFRESVEGVVTASYDGGSVVAGLLVGRRDGDVVRFAYAQLTVEGETPTGRSEDRIEVLADGRLRLHESWSWDSREGRGTSVLEEIQQD